MLVGSGMEHDIGRQFSDQPFEAATVADVGEDHLVVVEQATAAQLELEAVQSRFVEVEQEHVCSEPGQLPGDLAPDGTRRAGHHHPSTGDERAGGGADRTRVAAPQQAPTDLRHVHLVVACALGIVHTRMNVGARDEPLNGEPWSVRRTHQMGGETPRRLVSGASTSRQDLTPPVRPLAAAREHQHQTG